MHRKIINFNIENAFLIRAKGDSMIPKIHEGDIIIAEKSNFADSGQIVVCTYNNKALVKQYQKSGKHIILTSYNPEPEFKPILANPEEITIEGIVR